MPLNYFSPKQADVKNYTAKVPCLSLSTFTSQTGPALQMQGEATGVILGRAIPSLSLAETQPKKGTNFVVRKENNNATTLLHSISKKKEALFVTHTHTVRIYMGHNYKILEFNPQIRDFLSFTIVFTFEALGGLCTPLGWMCKDNNISWI